MDEERKKEKLDSLFKESKESSSKLNLYLLYGSSVVLIYIFNNLNASNASNILKIKLNKYILFTLVVFIVFNILFSLSQLYLNHKGIIENIKFYEELWYPRNEDMNNKLLDKIEKKLSRLLKISNIIEWFQVIFTIIIFGSIIKVFYNLILN